MYGLYCGKHIDSVLNFCLNNKIPVQTYNHAELLFKNKTDMNKADNFLNRLIKLG